MSSEHGQPTDTEEGSVAGLVWRLETQARSLESLAHELRMYAEELSMSRITYPEWIYKRLYVSIETFTLLLDNMRQSYAEYNDHEIGPYILALNARLVEAIHSILVQDQVTTMGESMTNTERANQKSTTNVGDMR